AKETAARLEEVRASVKDLKKKLKGLRRERDSNSQRLMGIDNEKTLLVGQQATKETLLQAQQQTKSNSKVVKALFQAQAKGELSGIIGSLRDLGVLVDQSVETALIVATGGGNNLDQIVVETDTQAKACIQFLRKHRLGQGNFVALNRVNSPQRSSTEGLPHDMKGNTEGISRLLNWVQCEDKVWPAFYLLLRDTLLCQTYDIAQNLLTETDKRRGKRHRCVTLGGDVLEASGTLTGGGRGAIRGRGFTRKAGDASTAVATLSSAEMRALTEEVDGIKQDLQRVRADYEACMSQGAALARQVTEAEEAYAMAQGEVALCESTLDTTERENQATLAEMRAFRESPAWDLAKGADTLKKTLEERVAERDAAAEELKEIRSNDPMHAALQATKDAQALVDRLASEAETLAAQEAQLRAQIAKHRKNLSDVVKRMMELNNLATAQQEVAQAMEGQEEEKQQSLDEAEAALDAAKAAVKEQERALVCASEEYRAFTDKLKSIKKERAKYTHHLEQIDRAEHGHNAQHEKQQAEAQRLVEEMTAINFAGVQDMEYAVYGDVDLAAMAVEAEKASLEKKVQVTANVLSTLCKEADMSVLEEYRCLLAREAERRSEFSAKDVAYEAVHEEFFDLTSKRRTELNTGLAEINSYLADYYRRLSIGGNASLETCMLPQSVSITVCPPKKGWREIRFLSGGEKSLASLAFILAIHRYRPAPFFVFDEIDAALDPSNAAIVASCIAESPAQFIFVSLRVDTFAQSERLVGVYSNKAGSHTVVFDPSRDMRA
ncbi:hypothetical protein KIPB_006779, partial [Kipferlia bialata]